jgi:hypothetical protein
VGVDVDRPSAARAYDYYLGGLHNVPVDRQIAREALRMWPELPQILQANRAFLRRAVRFAIHAGVTSFSTSGLGFPPSGNSHEVAQYLARVIDLDRPVAVLLVAVLHFIPDEDEPHSLVRQLGGAVAPGSLLAISHATQECQPEVANSHQRLYARTATPMTMRNQRHIREFFTGLDLADPGVVPMRERRPEIGPDAAEEAASVTWIGGFAGVGRKGRTR